METVAQLRAMHPGRETLIDAIMREFGMEDRQEAELLLDFEEGHDVDDVVEDDG